MFATTKDELVYRGLVHGDVSMVSAVKSGKTLTTSARNLSIASFGATTSGTSLIIPS
jgi:hypothetical protein